MYTPQHLNHLRGMVANAEQAAREAEQDLAGWRSLLAHAEANAPQHLQRCTCGLPGLPGMVHRLDGTDCYPVPDSGIHTRIYPYENLPLGTDTVVFPTGTTPFEQQPGLSRKQRKALDKLNEAHDQLCGDDGGPETADLCVAELNEFGAHTGPHTDGDGHTWPWSVAGGDS